MGQLIMLTCNECVWARRPNIVYTHATSLNSQSPPGLSLICIKRSKFAQEANSKNKENNHQLQKTKKEKTNIKTSRRHTRSRKKNRSQNTNDQQQQQQNGENIKATQKNTCLDGAEKQILFTILVISHFLKF